MRLEGQTAAGGWEPLVPGDEVMEKRNGNPNLRNEWRAGAAWSSTSESYKGHPLSLQTPVLPPTITDQIRLWELERDRLRFTEGAWLLVGFFWSLARRRTIQSGWTEKAVHAFYFLFTAWASKPMHVLFQDELMAVNKFSNGCDLDSARRGKLEGIQFSSVAQSCLILWPHGLQHPRLPCPSPTPGACTNSCPSSCWC